MMIAMVEYCVHLWMPYSCSLVPTLAVSVQTFPLNVTLYQQTYIDLICDPSIIEAVDTEVNISLTWTAYDKDGRSIDITEGDYNITNQSDNSTLRVDKLLISRDDMAVYGCLVSVTPRSWSPYVTGSESNAGNITLSVRGKLCTFLNWINYLK